VKTKDGAPYQGGALLAGLKALVDSLTPQRRTDVIKTLESVFTGMNADYEGRHSVHLQLEARRFPDSPSPDSPATIHLSDDLQNEHHESAEEEG
jgi:hypothetical protein